MVVGVLEHVSHLGTFGNREPVEVGATAFSFDDDLGGGILFGNRNFGEGGSRGGESEDGGDVDLHG